MDGGLRRERRVRGAGTDAGGGRPTSAGAGARVVPSLPGQLAPGSGPPLLTVGLRGGGCATATGRAVHGSTGVIRLLRGGDHSAVRVRGGAASRAACQRMTPLRSWLFIPGDSERKLAKAEGTGADVLI